jgi:hypothetical protein
MLLLRAGKSAEAAQAIAVGCDAAGRLVARDPSVVDWQSRSRECLRLRSELALTQGRKGEAIFLARQNLDAIRAEPPSGLQDQVALPQAYKLLGDILWRAGDRAGAAASWRAGLANWPKGLTPSPAQQAERGEMLRGIGERAEGSRIAAQLAAMGYRQSLSNVARV